MRFDNLDLNLLYALDVLLEENSITKAANRLHITQSAMSGILKRLREYFDDELLVKHGRQMQPTAFALSLQEPIREILLSIRATVGSKDQRELATSRRHFRFVTTDYAVTVLLADVVQDIGQHAPNLSFEFMRPDQNAAAALVRGDVDFMIVPESYVDKSQGHHQLFTEEFVCVVWEGNQHVQSELSVAQYSAMDHVTVGFGPDRELSLEHLLLNEQSQQRKLRVTCSDFTSLPQFLLGTQRIATMHRRLARYYARFLPLRILESPVPLPKLVEYLVWNKTMGNDPVLIWVRDYILSAVKQMD